MIHSGRHAYFYAHKTYRRMIQLSGKEAGNSTGNLPPMPFGSKFLITSNEWAARDYRARVYSQALASAHAREASQQNSQREASATLLHALPMQSGQNEESTKVSNSQINGTIASFRRRLKASNITSARQARRSSARVSRYFPRR